MEGPLLQAERPEKRIGQPKNHVPAQPDDKCKKTSHDYWKPTMKIAQGALKKGSNIVLIGRGLHGLMPQRERKEQVE